MISKPKGIGNMLEVDNSNTSISRGGTQFFFGGYVLLEFPKVGFRERDFPEKCGVFGAKIQKFCITRAEILAKNKAENAIFF